MSFCLKLFLLLTLPSGQCSIKVPAINQTRIPILVAPGSYLTSQYLSFLICKREIIIASKQLPLNEPPKVY